MACGRACCRPCGLVFLGAAVLLASARLAGAEEPLPAGYLFAHMTTSDYGHLYYAASPDGRHWTELNEGKRINDAYFGHPDITRGHDGRYYMIGVKRAPDAVGLWASDDLIRWNWERDLDPEMFNVGDHDSHKPFRGAPKLFFDDRTNLYVMTWHASFLQPTREDPERLWSGMRTFVVTSQDLVDFSQPQQLLPYDMATIDVIIRREEDRYVAILKDELYPSFDWPTGKTVRVATADHLLGPYGPPSAPISPNFREAPTVIPRPDGKGWYLYYEQYPGVSYGLSTAPALEGPWHGVYWKDYDVPPGARHGCMIGLDADTYQNILAAFGD